MAEVRWTEQALDDLDAICELIASDSPRSADALAVRITRAIMSLSEYPRLGRVVPERGQHDIREIIVRPYRVVFRL